MGKRQVFRGILQFTSHDALVHAMDIVLAEAPIGERIGLQDCFLAPGTMLFNLETSAPEQVWGETLEAFAILAENASRGFVFATFEDSEVEFFEAGQDQFMAMPASHKIKPEDDFFPFLEGSQTFLKGDFGHGPFQASWKTIKVPLPEMDAFYLCDPSMRNPGYNEYIDGSFFCKDGEFVYALYASDPDSLQNLDFENDNYALQLAYNAKAKVGDITTLIWTDTETFQVFQVEDIVPLKTEVGDLPKVMKIRVDNYQVGPDLFHKTTFHQYFAPGFGLVRVDAGNGSLAIQRFEAK